MFSERKAYSLALCSDITPDVFMKAFLSPIEISKTGGVCFLILLGCISMLHVIDVTGVIMLV